MASNMKNKSRAGRKLRAPSFAYDIQGRKVLVFDAVLSKAEQAQMSDAIAAAHHRRTQFSSPLPEFRAARSWACHYRASDAARLPLYEILMEYAGSHFPEKKVALHRAYVNTNTFGDLLLSHRDSPNEGALTGVYYVNSRWEAGWGGETIFFRDDEEAAACVSPKPGRLVLFDGLILHRGSPPLRHCYQGRSVLNFKLEPRTKRRS
jgi:SM-20-related protein